MKLNKRIITTLSVIIIGMEGLYHEATAETQVSGEALKALLSGNAVEGRYNKRETSHKMYFEASAYIIKKKVNGTLMIPVIYVSV